MKRLPILVNTIVLISALVLPANSLGQELVTPDPEKIILAHYMPWYVADEQNNRWGWHWTMNHFDPAIQNDGLPQIASQFHPLIGPYDSGDAAVLEYQLLLMKLSGIDGVVVDWYGRKDFNDYAILHRNTQKLIEKLADVGLKFVICYEDQTVPALVKANQIDSNDRVDHVQSEIEWLAQNWFNLDHYVRVNERPLLMSFGQNGLTANEWEMCQSKLSAPITYVSQHHRRQSAAGAFDWPLPKEGMSAVDRFNQTTKDWPLAIPVAFPGFHDIYEEAGVHSSWGFMEHADGRTFHETLEKGLSTNAKIVQIATWNDWGEGTQIEPSHENGTRDLVTIQNLRRKHVDPEFSFSAENLTLPLRLFRLRKRLPNEVTQQLDKIKQSILDGRFDDANLAMSKLEKEPEAAVQAKAEYRTKLDLAYRVNDDEYANQTCRLDLYYPINEPGFSTVVWFHGGGLKGGKRAISIELKQKGIAVVAVDYRLSPRVNTKVCIDDAAAAVAWTFDNIESFGGASDRIFVSGHSAGGYLTSMIGLDKKYLAKYGVDANQIAGLIPFSGHTITHMRVRWERGISDKQPIVDEMAPLYQLRKDAPPMLLITGDRELEMLGRYEENAYFWRMMKVIGHQDIRLVELQGKNHGQMVKPGMPLLLRFVQGQSKESTNSQTDRD